MRISGSFAKRALATARNWAELETLSASPTAMGPEDRPGKGAPDPGLAPPELWVAPTLLDLPVTRMNSPRQAIYRHLKGILQVSLFEAILSLFSLLTSPVLLDSFGKPPAPTRLHGMFHDGLIK